MFSVNERPRIANNSARTSLAFFLQDKEEFPYFPELRIKNKT